MEYSNLFVVLFGLGTVFFGLICIILLIGIMGTVIGLKKSASEQSEFPSAVTPAPEPVPNEDSIIAGDLIAAITCALAYELDANPRELGIMTIKKI